MKTSFHIFFFNYVAILYIQNILLYCTVGYFQQCCFIFLSMNTHTRVIKVRKPHFAVGKLFSIPWRMKDEDTLFWYQFMLTELGSYEWHKLIEQTNLYYMYKKQGWLWVISNKMWSKTSESWNQNCMVVGYCPQRIPTCTCHYRLRYDLRVGFNYFIYSIQKLRL